MWFRRGRQCGECYVKDFGGKDKGKQSVIIKVIPTQKKNLVCLKCFIILKGKNWKYWKRPVKYICINCEEEVLKKKCIVCKEKFLPYNGNQRTCGRHNNQRREKRYGQEGELGMSTGNTGAAHELLVAGKLMKLGYWVFRSLGPNGPFDLVAISMKNNTIYPIEVKTGHRNQNGKVGFSDQYYEKDKIYGIYLPAEDSFEFINLPKI